MNVKEMTRGAMCIGIYAVLLLLNMQFSLYIETAMPWLFVFPILIYAAMYGWQAGALVSLGMVLITFMFGSFTTWFYSWTSIACGYLYGGGVHAGWSGRTRLIWAFICSLVSNFLIMTVWAGIFGIDYAEDLALLKRYAPFLDFQVYLILLVLVMSIAQALCIHLLSLVICTRLQIKMVPMKRANSMQPNHWVCLLSLILWLASGPLYSLLVPTAQNFLIVVLFLDAFVLIYYGVLFFLHLALQRRQRWLAMVGTLGAFIPGLNIFWMLLGLVSGLLFYKAKRG